MLLAFTHFDNNEAHLSQRDYEDCLRIMWTEISRTYANKPIFIPLLGGGITRFDGTPNKSKSDLLKCMLCTLRTSLVNINQPITILLTEFVLYCLFLFPLSYVIAKNGYVEQNSVKYHFLTEQDTLYIETEKTEFETLYRLCFNQHDEKKVIFELKAVDDSNIDFVQSYTINGVRKFDCFAVYDNVADGNRFLFFDYENQAAYITPTCFSGFYPICSSVDFSKTEVLLQNEHSHLKQLNDTLSIDSKVAYVPFNCNNRIIKATLVPYPQARKGNRYLITKDSI